jgi:Type II secretion system (T2SS), protein M subtype b
MRFAGRRNKSSFLIVCQLAVLFLVFGSGFAVWQIWKAGEDSIAEQLKAYDKVKSIAAYETFLKEQSTPKGKVDVIGLFFPDQPSAILTAQMVTNIKQMAANHGLEVLRAGDLPEKTEGILNLVGSSFDFSGSIPNVYALIQDLDAARPYLFVDRIDLHSNTAGGAGENTDSVLTVTMQVYGAAIKGSPDGSVAK